VLRPDGSPIFTVQRDSILPGRKKFIAILLGKILILGTHKVSANENSGASAIPFRAWHFEHSRPRLLVKIKSRYTHDLNGGRFAYFFLNQTLAMWFVPTVVVIHMSLTVMSAGIESHGFLVIENPLIQQNCCLYTHTGQLPGIELKMPGGEMIEDDQVGPMGRQYTSIGFQWFKEARNFQVLQLVSDQRGDR